MHHLKPRKKSLALYILILIGVLVVMSLLKTCSAPRPDGPGRPDQRAGGDTLNVAIEYAPMTMISRGDTLAGFGYEMLNEIARRQRLKLKFTPIVSLSSAMKSMAEGRFDIVIAELALTAEFRERYRLTEPVYLDRQVLVQRRDSAGHVAVSTQLDLGGKRVRVIAGSPVIDRIRNLSREIGDTIIIESDTLYSSEQLFLLVASGEIPFTVINRSTASELARDYPDVDIDRGVSFSQFQSWIVSRRRKALADSIDSAIVRYRQTPAYFDLTRRYGVTPVAQQQ